MPEPQYEHGWEMAQLPDGGKIYRTTVTRLPRADIHWPTWELSLAIRARNHQPPPQPGTPEHFYRNERYGHIRDTDPIGTLIRRQR